MAFRTENRIFLNKKALFSEKIEFLTALSLFFSYAESFLPRFAPFFKLGLSNVVVLCALDFNFTSFLFLIFVKTVTGGIFSGILFSPFFALSVAQSFTSGICMFFLQKLNSVFKNKFCSIYGVSIFGAAASNFSQILLCSFYFGNGMFALLAPALVFSVFSGFFTAFLSNFAHIPQNLADFKIVAEAKSGAGELNQEIAQKSKIKKNLKNCLKRSRFFGIFIFLLCVCAFFFKNIKIALCFMIFAFSLQILFGKKIKILPYVCVWLFAIVFSLFIPNGKTLFKIGNFSVTQGALFTGILKSAKLSAAASFSQTIVILNFLPKKSTFLKNVKIYFSAIVETFKKSPGNVFKKLKKTLENPILNDV